MLLYPQTHNFTFSTCAHSLTHVVLQHSILRTETARSKPFCDEHAHMYRAHMHSTRAHTHTCTAHVHTHTCTAHTQADPEEYIMM